jgi:preprotein translocase subunit SecF
VPPDKGSIAFLGAMVFIIGFCTIRFHDDIERVIEELLTLIYGRHLTQKYMARPRKEFGYIVCAIGLVVIGYSIYASVVGS